MARFGKRKKKGSSIPFFIILILFFAAGGGYVFLKYFEGEKPQIEVDNLKTAIGKKSNLSLTVSDTKSGLRSITVSLKQGQVQKQVLTKEFPKMKQNLPGGHAKESISVDIDIKALGLKDGDATLKIGRAHV